MDQFVRLLYIGEIMFAQVVQALDVVIRMVPDAMSLLHDHPVFFRMFSHVVSDQEKGRFHPVSV